MHTITLTEFEKNIIQLIKTLKKKGKPVKITDSGNVVAILSPPEDEQNNNSWLGCMKGTGKIVGDIISPVID